MIYLFGDTHNRHDMGKLFNTIAYKKDDYIIVLGDFGLLWSDEKDEKELYLAAKLNALPCNVLFVDGNHENFNRIYALPQIEAFGSKVGQYASNIFHLRRGEIYNIDNMHFFTMGGALSIDKAYRKPNISWWAQEAITQDELDVAFSNIKNFRGNIDFVLSHTLPHRALNKLSEYIRIEHKIHDENPYKLEQIFMALQERNFDIKAWACGHWHADLDFKVAYSGRELGIYIMYNALSVAIDSAKSLHKIALNPFKQGEV